MSLKSPFTQARLKFYSFSIPKEMKKRGENKVKVSVSEMCRERGQKGTNRYIVGVLLMQLKLQKRFLFKVKFCDF